MISNAFKDARNYHPFVPLSLVPIQPPDLHLASLLSTTGHLSVSAQFFLSIGLLARLRFDCDAPEILRRQTSSPDARAV